MMKRITKWSLFAGLFLLAASCYKDKGNYDYEEFNEVVILIQGGGYLNPKVTDTFNIDPMLVYRGDTLQASNATEIFSFTWYCNDQEIHNGPVLHYPVRDLKGQKPYVKLKVVNRKDASTFLRGFRVDAIPAYLTGWLVLSKKDNRGILSFIDPVNFEVTADLYTTISGEQLGPNVTEVKEHWMSGSANSLPGNVLIVRNDAGGNIDLDGVDLKPVYKTNNFFLGNTIPPDFRPRGEFYMWDYSMMLDDNGNIYVRKHANNEFSQSGIYPNKPMFIAGGVKFDKGWNGTYLSGQTILYDNTQGRLFLGSDFGFVQPVKYMPGPPIPPGTTLITAMDKELVYVGRLQQGRFTSSYYLVFFDGSRHFVQKIMIVDQYFTVDAVFFYENPFGEGTANSQTVFCQLPRIDNYMFYSGGSGNKTLYLYEHGPASGSPYYTFDAPVKTITANQNTVIAGVHTHDQLMVGLENGDIYILGISSHHIANPSQRLIKKISLNQGVPVSTIFKMGFGFTQML